MFRYILSCSKIMWHYTDILQKCSIKTICNYFFSSMLSFFPFTHWCPIIIDIWFIENLVIFFSAKQANRFSKYLLNCGDRPGLVVIILAWGPGHPRFISHLRRKNFHLSDSSFSFTTYEENVVSTSYTNQREAFYANEEDGGFWARS